MPGERILVVDDEPDILSLLVYQLSREGYRISTAVDGPGAVSTALADRPDLIVLDLMLPGVDGYEVLRTLREDERTSEIPVLLLTARQEEEDRIHGFERGADDYVTKPFSPKELVLRVRALLRRTQAEPLDAHRRLNLGDVTVDRDAHRAFVGEREMELTPLEFRLLEVLMERRGRVQSRRQLLQAVWDTNAAIETRTVDMHVARLRSKLESAGDLIETVRGVGYRFRAEDV
ncbi:MAG: response regulator transcription factor [Candidatus Palauibacterales bacterium]|nr:response regulator transcription factor [Candidatus Palauibacterales bacterium]MDP2529753.1 response regulator transcription factor [Candidatus Palauibacterales bacterium]MDP2585108.1 response regulator transcription factor [Candidatus Palauibacterales bacterium]